LSPKKFPNFAESGRYKGLKNGRFEKVNDRLKLSICGQLTGIYIRCQSKKFKSAFLGISSGLEAYSRKN
jgi:hypothetical protein